MIVLITGGASGLGEAITRNIAAGQEHKIYFTYSRSADNAKAIEKDFPNAIAIKCDFGLEADVDSIKQQIAVINPDVLINNAYSGAYLNTYFHKTPPEDFLNEFRNNIIPTISITQAAINIFRKKKFGKIITILTSALVNTPPIGSSVYVANKAYLEELTKVWATENAKFNITSNSISPAMMLTSLTKDVDERMIEHIIENHPLKKMLTTEEVAEAVSYFMNATQHINGVNLVINAATNIK